MDQQDLMVDPDEVKVQVREAIERLRKKITEVTDVAEEEPPLFVPSEDTPSS
jgi:hypothetical protein